MTTGILRTPSDGKDRSNDVPQIELGPNGARLDWLGKDGAPMLHAWSDKFTIKRRGNELLVSVTVRDSLNNLIVEIKDNHWRVSEPTTNCWDKNYSDNALEVLDGRGRIVLQLRLFPDRVQLQAEFPRHDVVIYGKGYTEEDGIAQMFKYPSREHWGELLDGDVNQTMKSTNN